MRKLCHGLCFATMVMLVACGDSGSNSGDIDTDGEWVEQNSSDSDDSSSSVIPESSTSRKVLSSSGSSSSSATLESSSSKEQESSSGEKSCSSKGPESSSVDRSSSSKGPVSSSEETSSSSKELESSSEEMSSSSKEPESSSEVMSSSSKKPESSSEEKSSSSVWRPSSDGSIYDATANTLTDFRDGLTYRTVKIGGQVWMAENLNYRYQGSTATLDSSSFCYDNDPVNCDTYGRLYLWSAAMDSAGFIKGNMANGCGYRSTCSPGETVRGVCPKGWHLPDTTEWNALIDAVGGVSTASRMLKFTSGWNINGNGTDAFGFSALPGGHRYDNGSFGHEGERAYFWSTDVHNVAFSYHVTLLYCYDKSYLTTQLKNEGSSVRCLKD